MATSNRASDPQKAEVIILYPRQVDKGYDPMVGAILDARAYGKIPARSFLQDLKSLSSAPEMPSSTRGATIRLPRPTILGSHNAAKSLRAMLKRFGIAAITQEMPGTRDIAQALE